MSKIYDPNTGTYYDSETGAYWNDTPPAPSGPAPQGAYDPNTGTYYNGSTGAYWTDSPSAPQTGTTGSPVDNGLGLIGYIGGLQGKSTDQYLTDLGDYYAKNPYQQAPVAQWNADPNNQQPWGEYGYLAAAGQRVDKNTATNNGLIASLTGLSNDTGTKNQASLTSIQQLIDAQYTNDQNYVNQTQGLTNQLSGYRDTANAYDWNNLGTYQSGLTGLTNSNNAIYGNLGGTYNSMANPLVSTLQANALTSQAAQAYADPNSIAAQNNALGFLSGGMNGSLDYVSQGASTYADAALVAQQQRAANALQGVADGSKDVDFYNLPGMSDLGNASRGGLNVDFNGLAGVNNLANAAYGGLNVNLSDLGGSDVLRSAAYGGLDVNLNTLPGATDLYGAYKGSQDVHVGQEDPEAYAAMRDALGQYKALTDPRVTAAEDYIYEKARQKQEQDERGNREAVMTDLRQRGLSGAGAEIGQTALAGQQISQNRLLSDLGAQANAVNRSMAALAGYANLGGTMSGQANDIAKNNAGNRLTALGQYTNLAGDLYTANKNRQLGAAQTYTGLGADLATANSNRQLDANKYYTGLDADISTNNANRQLSALDSYTGMGVNVATNNMNRQANAQAQAYDAYAGMRNEDFSESAYRSSSADAASRANQQTQLSSGIAYGNLASTQRDQSFNESYKRGAAADQTAMFNENNRVDVQKYNQNYAQTERNAAWGRATDYANTGLNVNAQNANNLNNSYIAGRQTNQDTYGRNQDVIQMQDMTNTRGNVASNNLTDRGIGLQNSTIGVNNAGYERQAGLTGLGINTNNQATNMGVSIDLAKGDYWGTKLSVDTATAIAKKAVEDGKVPTSEKVGRWLTQPGYGLKGVI